MHFIVVCASVVLADSTIHVYGRYVVDDLSSKV